jgi:hypothetical protein
LLVTHVLPAVASMVLLSLETVLGILPVLFCVALRAQPSRIYSFPSTTTLFQVLWFAHVILLKLYDHVFSGVFVQVLTPFHHMMFQLSSVCGVCITLTEFGPSHHGSSFGNLRK